MHFFRTSVILVFLFLLTVNLKADERPFPYTYTTDVLKKNMRDFELHNNFRVGRENFFSRIDTRFEYEVGVTDKLQTAFYVNFKNETKENSLLNTYDTEFEFEGISSEWIYQVSNKYTNFMGFAPYVELTLNTREVELETKLLFDKKLGRDFTLALNLNAEYEWGFNPLPEKTEKELALEVFLGGSYQASKNFSFGFEAANLNYLPDGKGLESSALFLGPNICYRADNWFVTATWLHQLPALKKSENMPDSNLILDEHERNNFKVLVSFAL
ncbi:MAG: hypothetical protein JST55_00495 [Bacteroidetes bacterium]|nr:hypothetical protein [Bacteroidota bacterium]